MPVSGETLLKAPKWLKVQRFSVFIYTAISIALLVYALGFLTNSYIFYAFGDNRLREFYQAMQKINTGLLFKPILAIIFALALFIAQINKHAAGKYTLCIVLLVCAASLFISADSIVKIAAVRNEYTLLDLSELDWYIERGTIAYNYSTAVYDFGLVIYALFPAAALFMAAAVTRNSVTVQDIPAQKLSTGEKS